MLDSVVKITGIKSIQRFSDIVLLMDFVYKTLPWGEEPDDSWMKNTWEYQKKKISEIYIKFVERGIVGWCGANAQFLTLLLSLYKFKSVGYNYGILPTFFTHVGIIVFLDGMSFFMDPYFNKYYTYQGEFPLQVNDLLRLIQERNFSVIKPVYGPSKKPVITKTGEESWSSKQMEESVIGSFLDRGFKEKMLEIFGIYEPLLLLQIRIL